MEGGNYYMRNIDERIVQIQFDNAQFEQGIRTSVDSLDKLKKALDLEKSARGVIPK